MFPCSTLLLFPYPVPADIHRSVQHVTLECVPVEVLPRLFLWFSQVKHFKCHDIEPLQKVQCVHMYGEAWDAIVTFTNHYLTETRWKLAGRGGEPWGRLWPRCVESCVWGSCVGELWGELCVVISTPTRGIQCVHIQCG